eukprot:3191798-Alexandrium_andersonii.AAC.1
MVEARNSPRCPGICTSRLRIMGPTCDRKGAHRGSHGAAIGRGRNRAGAVGSVLKKSRARGNGDQSA